MKVTVMLFLVVLSLSQTCLAASKKSEVDIVQQCAQSAKEFFQENNKTSYSENNAADKDNSSVSVVSEYMNHFNSKMNACYVLLTTTTLYHRRTGQMDTQVQKQLFDIAGKNGISNFILFKNQVTQCELLNIICHSEAEWKSLVKSYLEE